MYWMLVDGRVCVAYIELGDDGKLVAIYQHRDNNWSYSSGLHVE
jgi:hypothetical protein